MFPLKTYIRLLVRDSDRAIAFYRALFGAGPAYHPDGTATFELESPPLVLTIEPSPGIRLAPGGEPRPGRAPGTAHYDLCVSEPQHVGEVAIALRRAGVRLTLEDRGVQASDPDGNTWAVRFEPRAKGRRVAVAGECRTRP